MSPGQNATIAGEHFVIKFVEIISDGRCPRGAICLWPGEANCLTEITTYTEPLYLKVLTHPGPFKTSKTSFPNYEITFDCNPTLSWARQSIKKAIIYIW